MPLQLKSKKTFLFVNCRNIQNIDMKKILFTLSLLAIGTGLIAQTACNPQETTILLAGDSWASFANSGNSIKKNLNRYGFTDRKFFSNNALSVFGIQTEDMIVPSYVNELANALNSNQKIDIAVLSIGGNDMLDNFDTTLTISQVDSIAAITLSNKDSIIKILDSIRPGIKIYFTQYDFPNFEEIITTFPAPTQHPFYSKWDDMSQPSALQLNTMLIRYDSLMRDFAALYPNVTCDPLTGVLQNIYGQTTPLGVAPGGTFQPGTAPIPSGFPDYPTNRDAMNFYGNGIYDAFHLSGQAYEEFYDYHFESKIFDMIRSQNDISFESEGGLNDGSTDGTTTNTNYITIGHDGASTATQAIVSFNSNGIPLGESLDIVSIFMKRDSITTTQPIAGGKILVTIKNGTFGITAGVETADYSDLGDGTDTACYYGLIDDNRSWIRIDIPSSLFGFINRTGQTQFKFEMVDQTNGEVYFVTGDGMHKPKMDVQYVAPDASINELKKTAALTVYPNPSSLNQLTVKLPDNYKQNFVTLIHLDGKQQTKTLNNGTINTNDLTKGIYIIRLANEGTVYQTKFVKL